MLQQRESSKARHGLRRRDLIAMIGGAAMAWPLVAHAQPRDGMRRLGVLMPFLASDPEGQARAAAVMRGLGALDWHEDGNLRIDWRWAGSDPALFERYAAELVALSPELLLAMGSPSVEALRRQGRTIPMVFALVTDPVGQGFVADLARPGGAITGFSAYDPPMAAARHRGSGLVLRPGSAGRAGSRRSRDRSDDGGARARRARRVSGSARRLYHRASRYHRRPRRPALGITIAPSLLATADEVIE